MGETIFGKIIKGEIPCNKAYEDDQVLAFHDIKPQAPVHVLIIPKREIPTTDDITPEDEALVGHMVWAAGEIARRLGLAADGYRLVFNCRDNAGQEVYHLHLHLLGGRKFGWPPG
ncbi:MAG: histidine triad nucleotide-binding protein [Candidatus Sumerlaeia bacterium]